jgi:hypothetical protein
VVVAEPVAVAVEVEDDDPIIVTRRGLAISPCGGR